MEQYIVTGMSCAACQARVEKAVAKLPGVTAVSVSLLTNSMGVEGSADPSAIIRAVEVAGYGASAKGNAEATKSGGSFSAEQEALRDAESPRLKKRLVISAGFLLALMYITMGANMLGGPLPRFFTGNYLGLALTQMLLAAIVMVVNNRFFTSGFKSLFHGAPNMDTLVALGSAVSFLWSLAVLYGMTAPGTTADELREIYRSQLYFETAAMIPALITIGKLLEALSKGRTTDALKSLMKLAPKTATVLRDNSEMIVPADEIRPGDVFIVRPGDSIPADGVVLSGSAAVNESALTGESVPVDKAEGDYVTAAAVNQSGFLTCRAEKVGKDTALAQIIRLVSDAAATKAPIARIADKVSGVFVPAVIGIAILVFAGWIIDGESVEFALARGISVLVISCPCALGLATPVAIMVGNGLGAKNGILFKTSEALENTGKIQIVALDKTGTITRGEPQVTDIIPVAGSDVRSLLTTAVSIEKKSEHPLAKAVVHAAEDQQISPRETVDFRALPGNGLEGTVDGNMVRAGSASYIGKFAAIPEHLSDVSERLSGEGKTPIFFEEEGRLIGLIAASDTVRSDSSEGIHQLENLGIRVVMLTGDNERTAKAIAWQAGIRSWVAGVLPDGKEKIIRQLQRSGKTAMVGDGINDAPALARADIGIAIGAGTDVAMDSADIVLVNSRLTDVAAAVRLSRAALRNIHENLFWAFFYNLICIPLAAGLLGWKMNPMIGAAAMSLSSFTVCMNALRLNLFKPHDVSRDKPLKNALPSVFLTARPNAVPANLQTARNTAMEKTVTIKGMMCGHCEAAVKKALEALPFVEEAKVSHETGKAVLSITGDFDAAAVKSTVEAKDYTVLGIE